MPQAKMEFHICLELMLKVSGLASVQLMHGFADMAQGRGLAAEGNRALF